MLSLPAEHPLLGRTVCRVGGCAATAHGSGNGGVCYRCCHRLTRAGLTGRDRSAGTAAVAGPAAGCAVPAASGCRRRRQDADRCASRTPGGSAVGPGTAIEEFLADPRVRPLPPLRAVPGRGVHAAARKASTATAPPTTSRWRTAVTTDPDTRPGRWQLAARRSPRPGRSACAGWRRWWWCRSWSGSSSGSAGGAKINDVNLRAVCDGAAPPAGRLDRSTADRGSVPRQARPGRC